MKEELMQQIEQMRLQDMGYKKIANELGLNRETVRYYSRKMGLTGARGKIKEKQYIVCERCGKEIEKSKQRKYCSSACRKKPKSKLKQTMYERVCIRCDKNFVTTNRKAKYCCEDCRFIKTKCRGCDKEFRSKEEGRRFCSVRCMSRLTRKSHEEFMVEFFDVHKGNIVPLELYQGSDIKLKAKCLHCGNCMNRLARQYIGIYKYGCRHCNNKSKGENEIANWLDNHGLEYQRQYSFPDLKHKNSLFFDFAIMDKGEVKALIEYDGEQHRKAVDFFGGEERLKETKERDELKNEYAKQNNITLLRIEKKKTITKLLGELL